MLSYESMIEGDMTDYGCDVCMIFGLLKAPTIDSPSSISHVQVNIAIREVRKRPYKQL